ncbi:MAG: hypothetical protein UT33_C0005G0032 [Candidatus Peregrinibacteria bacterium GW2011_GWC2_39_14]|nr:MAG: hypothetical protein US92_C0001G0032 [Candidatus Peregrinibacteria bacterium GW2011_GWA2_38_36]KKR07088.1 MAG: hypothetical protein UT33_C0005G0032 [Candidatus Peregrinibacteria bacterium GW2011_GWC2_39_14]
MIKIGVDGGPCGRSLEGAIDRANSLADKVNFYENNFSREQIEAGGEELRDVVFGDSTVEQLVVMQKYESWKIQVIVPFFDAGFSPEFLEEIGFLTVFQMSTIRPVRIARMDIEKLKLLRNVDLRVLQLFEDFAWSELSMNKMVAVLGLPLATLRQIERGGEGANLLDLLKRLSVTEIIAIDPQASALALSVKA